jgi:hypothetical protein
MSELRYPLLILVAGLLVFQASGAAIAGLSFLDANGDGRYDMQVDSPLPGWEVRLFSQDGRLVATNLTDRNGFFVFDELPSDGAYLVEEVRPRSWSGAGGAMRSVVLSSEDQAGEAVFHLDDDAGLRVRVPEEYVVFSARSQVNGPAIGGLVSDGEIGPTREEAGTGSCLHAAWLNGQVVPFRLSYDPKTGEVVYTVGCRTVSWTIPEAARTPIVHLALHARADAPHSRVDLFDIRLQAGGLPETILPDSGIGEKNTAVGAGSRGHDVLYIDADGIYGLDVGNTSLTVSGHQRLVWDPVHPPADRSFGYDIEAGARTFPESEIQYAKFSGASAETVQTPSPTETETPEPTKTVKETETPEQTGTVKETETPEPTKTVKETETPEQTGTVKETETPEATKTVKETETPEATKTVKETETPEATRSVKVTDTPEATKTVRETETPIPTGTVTTEPTGTVTAGRSPTGTPAETTTTSEPGGGGTKTIRSLPSSGTAVVDGSTGEWNLAADLFANMYRAGNPAKPLESRAYLRYDCATGTVYVLVLSEPGVPTLTWADDAWVKIDGGKAVDGTYPAFAWVGLSADGKTARGYEASFPLAPGSYTIDIHVQVFDDNEEQTSRLDAPLTFVLECATPTVTPTPTITEGRTYTPTPTETATETPTSTATPTETATSTIVPTETATETVTVTPTATVTEGQPPTETATPTPEETAPLPTTTPAGSISGSKWRDLDGDHKWDDGEPTLAGWTIYLEQQEKNGSDWLPVGSTLTDANGQYTFAGLAEGHYRVYEVVPPGWEQTYPTNNAGMHNLVISNGQPSWADQDFGNLGTATATPTVTPTQSGNGMLSVVKFDDRNGNGLRDEGEPGVADWLMTLYRDGSSLAVQATGPDGTTVFGELDPAGEYAVTEETRDGWTPTTPALVFANFSESLHVTVLIGNRMLPTETPTPTPLPTTSPGSISGSKWHDLDGDHKWDDGEPTLAGWTIYLEQQEKNGSDWLPVGSTLTDANGQYTFAGLAEGHYRVYEVVPPGWEQTYPTNNAGMHNLVISNGQPSWADQDFGNLGTPTPTPTATTTGTTTSTATPTATVTEGQPPTGTATPTPTETATTTATATPSTTAPETPTETATPTITPSVTETLPPTETASPTKPRYRRSPRAAPGPRRSHRPRRRPRPRRPRPPRLRRPRRRRSPKERPPPRRSPPHRPRRSRPRPARSPRPRP